MPAGADVGIGSFAARPRLLEACGGAHHWARQLAQLGHQEPILADLLKEEEMASSLPEAARAMFRLMLDLLAGLDGKIAALDKEIVRVLAMTKYRAG